MSQINQNEATKAYHSPQLKKLGNVSEVTQASSGSPGDSFDSGGSFPSVYAS
ncbi:MAG: lasso RiPP family leader peptide-containing protein [Cyanobacteria bacterium J06632_19]